MQVTPLGGGPPDEDAPPNGPDDIQPNLFEFFGFGQSIGPHGASAANQQNETQQNNEPQAQNQAQEIQAQDQALTHNWDLWPEQQPIIQVMANDAANHDANNVVDVPVVLAMPVAP